MNTSVVPAERYLKSLLWEAPKMTFPVLTVEAKRPENFSAALLPFPMARI